MCLLSLLIDNLQLETRKSLTFTIIVTLLPLCKRVVASEAEEVGVFSFHDYNSD